MNVLSKFLKKTPHFAKKTVLKKEIIDEVANRIHPVHPLTFAEILQTVDFENRYRGKGLGVFDSGEIHKFFSAKNNFSNFIETFFNFDNNYEHWQGKFNAIQQMIQDYRSEVNYLKNVIEVSDGGYESVLDDFVKEQTKNISEKKSNFMNEFMDEIIYSFFIEKDSHPLIHDYTNFAEAERRALYYNKKSFIQDELITFATIFEDAFFFLSNNFSAFSKLKLELIRPDLFEKQ